MLLFRNFELGFLISFGIVITLAFAYHEFAHAYVADKLGDWTPRSLGRITLNPFAHLDRTGLVMAVLIGFGWATTPVRPSNLRGEIRHSMALVAVAGPIANLIMAALFAVPFLLGFVEPLELWEIYDAVPQWLPTLPYLLSLGVFMNILLFVLNLVPIPPLDGFTILRGILPAELSSMLAVLQQYGFLILLLVFFVVPGFFSRFIIPPVQLLYDILTGGWLG